MTADESPPRRHGEDPRPPSEFTMPDGTLGRLRKRLGTRWASRTSNPVSGSRQAGGGFDSHTLPPAGDDGEAAGRPRDESTEAPAAGGGRRGRGRRSPRRGGVTCATGPQRVSAGEKRRA